MRASGRLAALLRLARRHQHHRGGAVVDAGGVAGGHACRPWRRPGAACAIASTVVPCLGYSSASTTMSPLRVFTVTGAISSLKWPAFCAASALFCEATANSSCCGAGDLPLAGDVLGGVAHVVAVEGVPEAVLDHGVDHLEVAHLHAVAQMRAVRRLAHRFLAAGDHDLGIAVEDRLVAERDRAQARAAELVDAPGRALDRDAGARSRPAGPGSGPGRRSGSGPG